MDKPWEFKTEDARSSDNLFTFIIFCEDEVSELLYFKCFESSFTKINVIPKQRSMFDNVIKAITYCLENDIMKKEDGDYCMNIDDVEVWCVFDRDSNKNEGVDNSKISIENVSFDESINLASRSGINVAWSNDAFELWVLLHFEDVDPTDTATYLRTYYYERLTNIFKSIEDPNVDLKKALAHATFGYKKDLKSKNNFKEIVRPLILQKTKIAIERAKTLEIFHEGKRNHYEKRPCTLVFKLVESIKNKGGAVVL